MNPDGRPFTLIIIEPTINKQLLVPGRDLRPAETRELLIRWGGSRPSVSKFEGYTVALRHEVMPFNVHVSLTSIRGHRPRGSG